MCPNVNLKVDYIIGFLCFIILCMLYIQYMLYLYVIKPIKLIFVDLKI